MASAHSPIQVSSTSATRRPVQLCRRAQRGARRRDREGDHPPGDGRHRQSRLFRHARRRAGLGRGFTVEEERPARTAAIVIISYALWARNGFDPDILEDDRAPQRRRLRMIGVAPRRFSGTTAIIGTEYFVPLGVHDAIESDFDSRDRHSAVRSRNHRCADCRRSRLKHGHARASQRASSR